MKGREFFSRWDGFVNWPIKRKNKILNSLGDPAKLEIPSKSNCHALVPECLGEVLFIVACLSKVIFN